MKIKIAIVVGVFLFLGSCTDRYCDSLTSAINNQCNNSYSDCQFEFKKAFDFDWDRLYIFDSMLYPDEISKVLGIDCDCEMVQDGKQLIFFIRGNKIVEKNISRCHDVSFVKMRKNGVVIIDSSMIFRMDRKRLNEKHHYYFFE